MSWWIYLTDPEGLNDPEGGVLESTQTRAEGGTYAIGGSTQCELNVTYNYGHLYHLVGFNIRDLDGKTARETIPDLEAAHERLKGPRHEDYWAPTPGNAAHALSVLLDMAREHPQGVWSVS